MWGGAMRARARRGLARPYAGSSDGAGRGGSGRAGREFFPERATRVQSKGAQRSAVAMCGRMVVLVAGRLVPAQALLRLYGDAETLSAYFATVNFALSQSEDFAKLENLNILIKTQRQISQEQMRFYRVYYRAWKLNETVASPPPALHRRGPKQTTIIMFTDSAARQGQSSGPGPRRQRRRRCLRPFAWLLCGQRSGRWP